MVHHLPRDRSRRSIDFLPYMLLACLVCGACATKPLVPFSEDTPPLVLVPTRQVGIQDKRARFREIYCAVLEARRNEIPDYLPCEVALTRLAGEAVGAGGEVVLGASSGSLIAAVVPGIGYDCFEPWLAAPGTSAGHVRKYGYDQLMIHVDALSGTQTNARQIRNAIMDMPQKPGDPRLVLIGYSKGAPDILEALVAYPELRGRVAAVVSAAGAVGGSPLANDAEQYQADLVRHFPKANCESGDGKGVESLRPAIRKAWLAENPLPREIRYYSLVALPQPERISWILESSYDKLSRVDARNDSQVIFYDAVVPGSTLLGYLNADHWAVALPIARTHTTIGALFVTQNAYPREALLEAVLRFVEEDLQAHGH
ncbi:hypothetical protein YTPLAS18_28640 [Nitrospira sp.]|nr:hypothetical protein YTPLAS18_28640 [Nitrospira sp.]